MPSTYIGFDIPIPLGDHGYFGSTNVDRIPPGGLNLARNIRAYEQSLRKVGGLELVDSNALSGTPTCFGGHAWRPDSDTQRQVTVWSNGKIFKEISDDIDSVELASGLTIANPVNFVEIGQQSLGDDRKLLIFCEGQMPHSLTADGATTSVLSNVPTSWSTTPPAFGISHDRKVYAFKEHQCYTSKTKDHEDFSGGLPGAPIFQIQPGLGERISAAISVSDTKLLVFKYPEGLVQVDTTNVVTGYIPCPILSQDIGAPGPNAVVEAEGNIFCINSNGHIYEIITALNESNYNRADLTATFKLEEWTKQNVDTTYAKLKYAQLIYDGRRKELWAMFIGRDANTVNVGLVFDLSNRQQPKVFVEDRGEYFNAMWLSRESEQQTEVLCSGTGGLVYRADGGNRTIGTSTVYEGVFGLPSTDFAWFDSQLKNKRKDFEYLTLTILPKGSHNVEITFLIDGQVYRTTSVDMGGIGSQLDDSSIGLDPATAPKTNFILGGGGEVAIKTIPIGGNGYRLGWILSNSGSNEDFEILDATVSCRISDMKGEI